MNNLKQCLYCCCVLLAVPISCFAALPDAGQYIETITNLVPIVIQQWQRVEQSYDKMVAQNIKDTFGKGTMNTFTKLGHETAQCMLARGFYAMDPAVHVLFSDLTIQHPPPVMEHIDVDIHIAGNVLIFASNLTDIHIKTHYSLHRLNPGSVVDSDRPVAGVSPFLLEKVEEYGDVTIVADRCYFEGILLLVPSEQTFAVANSNYRITGCNFNLEIVSKVMRTAPLFVPYFVAGEAKDLQALMAQTLGTMMDLRVKTALVSTFNTTNLFGANYQTQFGFAYSFFNTYLGSLWSEMFDTINDNGKGNTVNLNTMDLDTQFKFLWVNKIQSMDVQISNLQLHGLNTAFSGRTGTVVKCKDCSKILLVETIRFSRLQITGTALRSGVGSKFSAELRDAKVLVSLVENVKEKTKSLYSTHVSGFRNIEYLFTDTNIELLIRDMLASSITAYVIRIIPDFLTRYITENVPGALDNRNRTPVSDDDTLRQLLTAIFGDLE